MIEPISQVERYVRQHHTEIADVQNDDKIEGKNRFVKRSGDVSNENDDEKRQALPGDGPRAYRFINGERPRGAETYEHYYFEWTHSADIMPYYNRCKPLPGLRNGLRAHSPAA